MNNKYNGSSENISNLKYARAEALKKVDCKYCNKSFSKIGISRHEKVCINKVYKNCPVCDVLFSKPSVTCSHACANTYFRSGVNNPNWKDASYRTTCFLYHDKKCVVCNEDNIVEVHHYDENSDNNAPENLIPLCPTHHQYWHSRYKHLIENVVKSYIDNWNLDKI